MSSQPDPTTALHARAMDNLGFIRDTMERAASFTAVPGWGGVAMGGIALVASFAAREARAPATWLAVWAGAATLAIAVGVAALTRKARRTEGYVLTRPARRFLLGYLPPLGAGAVLTVVLARVGLIALLPGTWLLLYGTALVTGGASSIRIVPVMGACFIAVGVLALLGPEEWGNIWMAVGFGLLHVGFGLVIARRHGG